MASTSSHPPDPGRAGTLDDLADQLRRLKVWAGDPSFGTITDRINEAWKGAGRPAGELARRTTVADCFKAGRRRLNADLVIAVVQAIHPDVGYVAQWRQALRVVGGEVRAAAQVRVQDALPRDLDGFTGRGAELDRLRQVPRPGGGAVVISAIEGMAGVGKTQLAIHAGHLLAREAPFDRVLFVNLRGFHPDPAQPPADPAAVLDGFLRLLGVPAAQIPYDLEARASTYRGLLAGTRTLVVLDNAVDEEQVRPLLAEDPGCLTMVTSRRRLAGLRTARHVTVDVFSPDEATEFLARSAPAVPVGDDPDAPARVARRCGYLPLALGLIVGHMLAKPGWTVTDHADWLDERHRDRRLDDGVALALDLSYQHLPAERRQLLRLVASHPGQDLDGYAAAALTGTDLPTARAQLDLLCRDHLLQPAARGRYAFHDLVRGYAAGRCSDEDAPPARRAALTRLFDYYLATAAAAMDTLHKAEAHRRPRVSPPATPAPVLTDPGAAHSWLDTEADNLIAVAGHAATHGWPGHATRLSPTLFRYLDSDRLDDALTVHGHARRAARQTGDVSAEGEALLGLGSALLRMGRYEQGAEEFQRALNCFRHTGEPVGQARATGYLGISAERLGRFKDAANHHEQALALYQQAGDRTGEAWTLTNFAILEGRLGRYGSAADHCGQALALFRQAGHEFGQAVALNNLGSAETALGLYGPAADHLQQSLATYRRLGNREGEAGTLDSLGTVHTLLGQPARAVEFHRQALAIFRDIGERDGEPSALNGLGEATHAAGDHRAALAEHTAALTVATDVGARDQQARAHAGLAAAHRALDHAALARGHCEEALTLYTDLGMSEADQVRADLDAIDGRSG